MSTPIDNIKSWSDVQLVEDENDDNSVSAAKYNEHCRRARACKEEAEQRACGEVEHRQAEEQRRVEVERRRAEEQAKRRVSHLWLAMTELTGVGGGGCRTTVQQGQGESVRAAGVQPVCRVWAQVQAQAQQVHLVQGVLRGKGEMRAPQR